MFIESPDAEQMPGYRFDPPFRDKAIHHSLELFSDAEIDAFEEEIFRKNGKPYVKCLASGQGWAAKQAYHEEI